ncbi:MAG: ASCH domain-containing protein [Hyphomicrobiaceae bacterium]
MTQSQTIPFLPMLALSVRQPWAWAIIHAGKDIENRDWQPHNPGLKVRGRIAIHASKGLGRDEYEDARDFIDETIVGTCPEARHLARACIIGSVEVVNVVTKSSSPWFFGLRGLVLRNPEPCEPIPCIGQLGFWNWQVASLELPQPLPWMLPKTAKPPRIKPEPSPGTDLFTREKP